MPSPNPSRIQSIDMLRGLVMILMALDHVRDYFHYDSFFYSPTDFTQTSIPLFFTRFITHFCAPVFCFLAGTSAFFVGRKKSKGELAAWLIKRGIWLIILEFTVINFAWYFQFNSQFLDLSVIWCLGVSMIFLAGFVFLPKYFAWGIALFLVFGHNLLDSFTPDSTGLWADIWRIFHQESEVRIQSFTLYVVYPVMPWIGLMVLGYFFGQLYLPETSPILRKKILMGIGSALLLLFLIFRVSNIYGDLVPWTIQDSGSFTILSILNVTKYPPSFAFVCITLGPALVVLAWMENASGKLSKNLVTVGQVPMFFYIIHLFLIHLLASLAAVSQGYTLKDMTLDTWIPFNTHLQGYGFSLPMVYLVWIMAILLLYPLCAWYNSYKKTHREYWWLSYL